LVFFLPYALNLTPYADINRAIGLTLELLVDYNPTTAAGGY
jgi:hypothetical protein